MSILKKKLSQAKLLVFGKSEGNILELTIEKAKIVSKRAWALISVWK